MAKVYKLTLYLAGRDDHYVHGDVDPVAHLNGDLYHSPVHYHVEDVESVDVGGTYDHDGHILNRSKWWGELNGDGDISELYEKHKD